MVVDHAPVHDHHAEVLAADALHSQPVGVAVAQAEGFGHLGHLDVHHGARREGSNLFAILYALHKVMEGVFTVEICLPSESVCVCVHVEVRVCVCVCVCAEA